MLHGLYDTPLFSQTESILCHLCVHYHSKSCQWNCAEATGTARAPNSRGSSGAIAQNARSRCLYRLSQNKLCQVCPANIKIAAVNANVRSQPRKLHCCQGQRNEMWYSGNIQSLPSAALSATDTSLSFECHVSRRPYGHNTRRPSNCFARPAFVKPQAFLLLGFLLSHDVHLPRMNTHGYQNIPLATR